jgi:hypothetical protein
MIQLLSAQNKIKLLNVEIKKKCPQLSLELDYFNAFKNRENLSINTDMINPQFVLCLNYDDNCISSIVCKINKKNKSMEISSKTHETHEGKKYNTLLRSAIMLVAPLIKYNTSSRSVTRSRSRSRTRSRSKSRRRVSNNITQIISRSINPISSLLLVKYFGAKNKDLDKFIKDNNYNRDELTLDQIKEFQQEPNTDELTSSEELEFMENNENYGEPLLLTVSLNDPSVIFKIENTFNSTLLKMICP